uniref:Sodium/calcium exchanger membrane region domain-containing protein n=1 Tax=Timema bartmani TaxID=61472 RepID=A0A7R9EPV2_9NEOP|nr:unnamed protein product [Timema bartmani]
MGGVLDRLKMSRRWSKREKWPVLCGLVLLYAFVHVTSQDNDGVGATIGLSSKHHTTHYTTPYTTHESAEKAASTTPVGPTAHPTLRPRRTNCSPPAIEQFPRPLMSQHARKSGGLILHVLAAVYTFLGLAIVCDDYFVSSLDRICEELKLSPDVAGATFMAAGSSAPELATVVIGVFFAQDDIGVSGVIGSAVFNIMFVIAVCALCAQTVCYLNWWPLCRDCFFYSVAILVMLFTIYDGSISWDESLLMLIMYVVYCVVLHFNPRLERWAQTLPVPCKHPPPEEESALVSYKHLQEDKSRRPSYTTSPTSEKALNFNSEQGDAVTKEPVSQPQQPSGAPTLPPPPIQTEYYKARESNPNEIVRSCNEDGKGENTKENDGDEVPIFRKNTARKAKKELGGAETESVQVSPLIMPTDEGLMAKISWGVTVPIHALCRATIPDCKQEKWRQWYPFTFVVSMVWISFYSYIMVWMITVIGSTLGIPDTVMGLTFVAAGVSVPDALSSLAVVKEGYGDMAVSNAVGSNVFDILVCLGLPWFIQTALIKPGSHVNVFSKGLTYSTLSLLSTVLFLVVATHLNGWKLDKKYGLILMGWYLFFITFASLYELNVFGDMNPIECATEY